jgi:hypothetical protein
MLSAVKTRIRVLRHREFDIGKEAGEESSLLLCMFLLLLLAEEDIGSNSGVSSVV